jgi:hypothetical protein
MRGRHRLADVIPERQSTTVGVNIRTLRRRRGWSQATLGDLMGWQSSSTVCAAEGHRDGRQRGFTVAEVKQLADIFGVRPSQLTTRCANCEGHPPAGFACLACGAALSGDSVAKTLATDTRAHSVRHDHEEARG